MKYIVQETFPIWRDEEMTEACENVPVGAVIEETRPTRHKRSDAIWLRYDGKRFGNALEDDFQRCVKEAGDNAAGKPDGHYQTVRFKRF